MSVFDAYAAGLLDGDGCVYVVAARHGRSYSPRVDFNMGEKARGLLQVLQKEFGGSFREDRSIRPKNHAPMVQWSCSGQQAATFIERTMPYLVLKQRPAELALTVHRIHLSLSPPEHLKYARWTPEALRECELIRLQIQELNRKGPDPVIFSTDSPVPGMKLIAHRVGGEWMTFQRDLLSKTGWQPFVEPWPSSGMMSHGMLSMPSTGFLSDDVGCLCSPATHPKLSEVLELDAPQKYSLSRKACAGILRRAEKRGKALPALLVAALMAMAGVRTPTE